MIDYFLPLWTLPEPYGSWLATFASFASIGVYLAPGPAMISAVRQGQFPHTTSALVCTLIGWLLFCVWRCFLGVCGGCFLSCNVRQANCHKNQPTVVCAQPHASMLLSCTLWGLYGRARHAPAVARTAASGMGECAI